MAQFVPTSTQFGDYGFTSYQSGPPGHQFTIYKKDTINTSDQDNGEVYFLTTSSTWYEKAVVSTEYVTDSLLDIETEEELLTYLKVKRIPAP